MPIPFIIGAAVAASLSYGAKKGYDGYQKHSEADNIVNNAKQRYETKRLAFDKQEKATMLALEELGSKELEIGSKFSEFTTLAEDLLQQLNVGQQSKIEVNLPKHELQRIENYSYTAVGVLGAVAGAGAAGAAAGFAVYGGVMTLGFASTGTAISALGGVAATNATLAAIGGGSLATGGLGMAGGTAILGAAVAAPVLAIAGWAYNSHGEEALNNARKASREVDSAVVKLIIAIGQLGSTKNYVSKIELTLTSIYGQFNQYFDTLKDIDGYLQGAKRLKLDMNVELNKFSEEILRSIENGYALASILVDVITTPIFKLKVADGQVVSNSDGVPEVDKDADGSMMLNDNALDKALLGAEAGARSIEAA